MLLDREQTRIMVYGSQEEWESIVNKTLDDGMGGENNENSDYIQ